jgi:hypothetical protein
LDNDQDIHVLGMPLPCSDHRNSNYLTEAEQPTQQHEGNPYNFMIRNPPLEKYEPGVNSEDDFKEGVDERITLFIGCAKLRSNISVDRHKCWSEVIHLETCSFFGETWEGLDAVIVYAIMTKSR